LEYRVTLSPPSLDDTIMAVSADAINRLAESATADMTTPTDSVTFQMADPVFGLIIGLDPTAE
jgi:hypothetical protein